MSPTCDVCGSPDCRVSVTVVWKNGQVAHLPLESEAHLRALEALCHMAGWTLEEAISSFVADREAAHGRAS